MTLISFIILRYRLLKRGLDQMEIWTSKLFPKEE